MTAHDLLSEWEKENHIDSYETDITEKILFILIEKARRATLKEVERWMTNETDLFYQMEFGQEWRKFKARFLTSDHSHQKADVISSKEPLADTQQRDSKSKGSDERASRQALKSTSNKRDGSPMPADLNSQDADVCACGRRIVCLNCSRTHLCLRYCPRFQDSIDCKKFTPATEGRS